MERELCLGFYRTPSLWMNTQFGISQFRFPELDFTIFKALPIPERLRIGHKMEHVFAQLIQFSGDWDVVAKNLLVDTNKERIGELDFLIRHKPTAAVYHVELAYKFYIINPRITEPMHRLMGPNKRDMFYTKLDKLKGKQFPLLFNEELNPKLESLNLNLNEIRQEACFKAQLFKPYGANATNIRPLNKNCIQGSWIRFEDFNTQEFKNFEYYIPYKQEWILIPSTKRTYVSHYETLLDINLRMLKENAPMLWLKRPSGEIEKLFVVWW